MPHSPKSRVDSVTGTGSGPGNTRGNYQRSRVTPRTGGKIKTSGERIHTKRFRKSPAIESSCAIPEQESLKLKQNSQSNVNVDPEIDSDADETSFPDHGELSQRVAKSMYFGNKLPSTPRPSLPLTVLAVNAFTKGSFAPRDQSLEFLDLEMAAEIGRNACVSPTTLIMALVYMERLTNQNPGYLSTAKPSELFVVSLLVASKFIQDDGEDVGIYNDEWAASAQLDLKRVNKLELQFLSALDWRLNVSREDYDRILRKVEGNLALVQGLNRGWFTYAELGTLSNSVLAWKFIWPTLFDYVLKVISAASMTYTAILATVLTSSILAPQIFILTKCLLSSNVLLNCRTMSTMESFLVTQQNLSTNDSIKYLFEPENEFLTDVLHNENETKDQYLLDNSDYVNNGCPMFDMSFETKLLQGFSSKLLERNVRMKSRFFFQNDKKAFDDLPLFHHKEIPSRVFFEETESAFVQNLRRLLTTQDEQSCEHIDWNSKNNKQYFS